MQIALYGRQFGIHFRPFAEKLLDRLRNNNIKISMYKPFFLFMQNEAGLDPKPEKLFSSHKDLEMKSDFVFSIGGDGTILETITLSGIQAIPVMGINSGKLGFLASISGIDTDMAIDALLSGKYSIEKRSLLETCLCR
jgi:NAD+ kinase